MTTPTIVPNPNPYTTEKIPYVSLNSKAAIAALNVALNFANWEGTKIRLDCKYESKMALNPTNVNIVKKMRVISIVNAFVSPIIGPNNNPTIVSVNSIPIMLKMMNKTTEPFNRAFAFASLAPSPF